MQRRNTNGEKQSFINQGKNEKREKNYGSIKRSDEIELDSIDEKNYSETRTTLNPIQHKYRKILNSEQNNVDDYSIDDVVIRSSLICEDSQKQALNIVNEFNKRVVKGQETFAPSYFIGEWVQPDEFLLGACNSIPELSFYNGAMKISRQWYLSPSINTELLGRPKQTELFYGAYGSYVLNVPVNKFAKAWSGTLPVILGPGPHVIHDSNFKFEKNNLVDQFQPYINHGFINIIRVPAGKIAKVWINTQPFLLESRKEPYVFATPYFRLDPKNKNDAFYDATEELIVHGSIKRVIVPSGKVAIISNCGSVDVMASNQDKLPIIIDSPLDEVIGFLDTNVQHFIFPSEKKQLEQLKSNNSDNPAETSNFVFTTKESLKITAKIFIAFGINDPKTTLRLLTTYDRIIELVENTAIVEMGRAILAISSQEFLNRSFQESVFEKMTKILGSYGITLTFLNVETPRVLDKEVEKQLAEGAKMTAEQHTKESVLLLKTQNDIADAHRIAETENIKQEQINKAKVNSARADLEAAELHGQAILTTAKAQSQADIMRAEVYNTHPVLVDLEKTKMITKAIEGSNFVMPCPTQPLSHVMDTKSYQNPFTFFTPHGEPRIQEQTQVFNQEKQSVQPLATHYLK